ncbi:MAG: aminoacyl-tRNA hydrolase [bacterium]|nr:aminoacyl-tRNA hydrolase [bacterium]
MKLIIGLGNIGDKYQDTRHNIGFKIIDEIIAKDLCSPFYNFENCALIKKGGNIIYVKPTTFMNNSGQAIRRLMDYYKISLADILVVFDDMQLDLGNIRLKIKGSSGGHNGIKSIIQHLGTPNFARLKIGVGECTQAELSKFVLSKFKKADLKVVEEMIGRAASAVKIWDRAGSGEVMQKFNKKNI